MASNQKTRPVRTVCPAHCGIDACGILAHVKEDRVVKVAPADFPNPRYRRICLRGLSSLEITYHPDRLKYPMKRAGERGSGNFERITWDEALGSIAEKFKAIATKYGWPAVAWVLGGPGAGTTKFGAYLRLASLTRSTRVSAWGYGDSALPCGSRVLFGSQFPYAFLFGSLFSSSSAPEILVVWGANPGESQPLNLMRPIMDAKEKGALLIVIDPRFTVTASKADAYLGVKPGTDTALSLGLMNVIFRENFQDDAFIQKHTVGPYLVRTDTGEFLRAKDIGLQDGMDYIIWDIVSESPRSRSTANVKPATSGTFTVNGVACKTSLQLLMDLAAEYPPARTAEITGISSDIITRLALRIGSAKSVTFVTHMGFTRTYHGDISLRALGTVAAVTGNVSATFRGGHLPAVLNWKPFLHADPQKPSYTRMGILQLYDAVTSGKPYPVKAVWFSFINFLNQCADSGKIANEFFPELEFIVSTDLFMTPTARYADILLPVCSYLEFSDLIPFPYPYLQLQQKVMTPLYESKSDVDIAAELAGRLGFSEYFDGGEESFIDLILASEDPSLEGITREKLKQGPMPLKFIPKMDQEIDIPFSTPSGKIEIYSEKLRGVGQALPVFLEHLETPLKPEGKKYPLAFIQGHSRFRTHSMYANVTSLLEFNPEPVLEINPRDAQERNIADEDPVTVFNDRARTTLRARVTEGVRPGVVNISEGWWIDQFKEGSVNHLTHAVMNPVQEKIYEPNMHMNDVAVEVIKYQEVES
ncbi:MAG: molybdopterin-dependent oxidoreductase [Deltaproteobacteria bacterium]|nr:MAG: molybdopterin-dependent oxidoreductase [Deltaproteobacteria bacterium]